MAILIVNFRNPTRLTWKVRSGLISVPARLNNLNELRNKVKETLNKSGLTDSEAVIQAREEEGEEHEGEIQSARENVHYQHVDKKSKK